MDLSKEDQSRHKGRTRLPYTAKTCPASSSIYCETASANQKPPSEEPVLSPPARGSLSKSGSGRCSSQPRKENLPGLDGYIEDASIEDRARKILGLADNRVNAGRLRGTKASLESVPPVLPESVKQAAGSDLKKKQRLRHSSPYTRRESSDACRSGEMQNHSSPYVSRGSSESASQERRESQRQGGPANSQSLRSLAQQIAEEIIVRGTPPAGGATPGRPLSTLLSQAQDLKTTAKTAGTAGGLRRRLHEALRQAGAQSLENAEKQQSNVYSKERSRTSISQKSEETCLLKGERPVAEGQLESNLGAEKEGALQKEAGEKVKKLQRQMRRLEEEKRALMERVTAASQDRADAQKALLGASGEVALLTSEKQKAHLQAQRLSAEVELLKKETVSKKEVVQLERELERARRESKGLENENRRLLQEMHAMGSRQSEQAAKLASFQAQMHVHMDKFLEAERLMEGFKKGFGEQRLLERVKALEAESAAKQARVGQLERELFESSQLRSEVETLRGQLETREEMRRDLEAALSRARGVQDELKKERAGGGTLRQEVSGLKTQVGILEETLRASEEARSRAEKESAEKEKTRGEGDVRMKERIAALEREVVDAQEEVQAGEKKLLASARKESQMRVELREAKARVEGLKRAKGDLEVQLETAKAAEAKAVSRAEKALHEKERQVFELTGRLAGMERANAEAAEGFEALREDMQREIDLARARIERVEREYAAENSSADTAKKELDASRAKEEQLTKEVKELLDTKDALKAEVLSRTIEHERHTEGLEASLAGAQADIERLTSEKVEITSAMEALRQSEKEAKQKLVLMREEADKERQSERRLTERLAEVEGLAERLKQSESEARAEVARAEAKAAELERSLEAKRRELQAAEVARKEAEERAKSAEARGKVAANRAAQKLKESESKGSGLEELLKTMEIERRAETEELIGRLDAAERELGDCKERLRFAEDHCETLDRRLGEAAELIQQFQTREKEGAARMEEALEREETRARNAEKELLRFARVRDLEGALERANEELERPGKHGAEIERLRADLEKMDGRLRSEQRRAADLEEQVLEMEGQLSMARDASDPDFYVTPQKPWGRFG